MLQRKFHRNNVLWICCTCPGSHNHIQKMFQAPYLWTAMIVVIGNIGLTMRPWSSLPNRAIDPLLPFLLEYLQDGSGIRCSTLTLNTSQAAGTRETIDMIERLERLYRSLKHYHRYLNLILHQKGGSNSSRPILKEHYQPSKMGRACKEPNTKGQVDDFAALEQAHSFCLDSQIFW